MATPLNITRRTVHLPDFGRCEELPSIPEKRYEERLNSLTQAMRAEQLDVLLIFADREHSANLTWLTRLDPRFEEGLLLLDQRGKRKMLLGNECMGYTGICPIPMEFELFQEFSLMGQDRSKSRSLQQVLGDFGIQSGTRVGCIYYKYFADPLMLELPAWIVDLLRNMVGSASLVVNAGHLLMDPARGLRHHNCLEELVAFEWASCRTSDSIRNLLNALKPGIREYELARHFQSDGLPYSCHPMVSTGDKAAMGLSSPSGRRVQAGDAFTCALGIWGALTARAGIVAHGPDELEPSRAAYYEQYWKAYFRTVVTWYESIGIGVSAAAMTVAVDEARDPQAFSFAVNTGHTLHLDEWVHSPFTKDSAVMLHSSMALQMDIIPVGKGAVCANTEDGVVLADEQLRRRWSEEFPASWQRIQARRAFMQNVIGIQLKPEVLPLSNTPAFYTPYLLAHQEVAVVGKNR